MKSLLLYPLTILLIVTSCKKEATIVPAEPDLTALKDTCSYTIDGRLYTANLVRQYGTGSAEVNLDSVTDRGKSDSIQFNRNFTFKEKDGAEFKILFIKNYSRKELSSVYAPGPQGIAGPPNESETLYPKGELGYAVDYYRSNTTNGAALEIFVPSGPYQGTLLRTYMNHYRTVPNTLTFDCQNDSRFNITNIYTLPDGRKIIEAKFTANLFTKDEERRRLENGYLLLHVPY